MEFVIIDNKKYKKEIANKIFEAQENIAHYDLLQLTKKIQLNSAYGALLSAGFRWSYKEWIGASVTYTGRAITTHMINEIAFILSGTYANLKKTFSLEKSKGIFKVKNIYTSDHSNILYGDTDSVDSSSLIRTDDTYEYTIEDLFNNGSIVKEEKTNKEYSFINKKCLTLDNDLKLCYMKPKWIYRHKVSKAKWKIATETKSVIVTNDHSVMIWRGGELFEVKPSQINKDIDKCVITNLITNPLSNETNIEPIFKVEQLEDFEDEYVYDITMEDEMVPYFFANGILVHNSNYFLTDANNKEEAIIIADEASSYVNSTFKNFMKESFFCNEGFDNIIKAGREIVAERGLFQAHKKYIAKVVNLDGFDVDKIKAMGSEIKKSDTPKVIQKFLKETVSQILDGKEYKHICEYVNDQRKKIFKEKISPKELILLGTAKSANDFEHYEEVYYAELSGKPMKKANGKSKITVPGHIRASINYNRLLEEFNDLDNPKINNGDKVKVFQLKQNDFRFETIAFPADIVQFPKWFIENFELDLIKSEEKLITAKLQGIFDAMELDVPTPQSTFINSVIEF
jgi:hypothetical protein